MPYKPKQVLRALKRFGFKEVRQRGSHLYLRHPDGRSTILPMHRTTMKRGLFYAILKDAGLTEQAFQGLL